MATFYLTDDGTLDTVIRCADCGRELRYNYDGGMDAGPDDGQPMREQDALAAYDEFVNDCLLGAESEHVCDDDSDI